MTAIKTLLWSIIVPGAITLYVPYVLLSSKLDPLHINLSYLRYAGLLLILIGVLDYVWCAWNFTFVGKGTPAPFDPPKELVAQGPYRYVRNPMYVFVALALIGEAIFLEAMILAILAAVVIAFLHVWVLIYEEPTLRRKFGDSYERYCKRVPRWLPRLLLS